MEAAKNLIKVATVAIVLAVTSVSVQAQPADTQDITVRLYDLDLSKSADASTLLSRVHQAAKSTCTRIGDDRDMNAARERSSCIKASYAQTIATINKSIRKDVEEIAARGKLVQKVASTSK
jgi:UrcA family protein